MKFADAWAIGKHSVQARWRWRQLKQSNLAAFHDQRMRQIVRHAHDHSAWYREHWHGHNLNDWRNLPTTNKSLMMDNFSTFNTVGISREQAFEVALRAEHERDFSPTLNGMTVGLSSGTSGHRGVFLVAPNEQRAWAGTILARMLTVRDLPAKIAFFLRSNSNLYEQVGSRVVRFRYFDLMLPIEQAVAGLNQFQPTIIIAPPSLLQMLADAPNLHIAPRRMISVAEVLEPHDQTMLQARFGVAIEQIYQCTEGLIAASCRHGSLHIQEDVVAIQTETLDDGRIQPIVTDLWRMTQPIVRYRLNDLLVLDNRLCQCGSDWRVIKSIEGRGDDVFYFPDHAGGLRHVFPDTIRRMILLAHDDIHEYQAIQRTDGELEIRLLIGDQALWHDVVRSVERTVHQTLASYNCCASHVSILPDLIERPAGTKRRRVWREKSEIRNQKSK